MTKIKRLLPLLLFAAALAVAAEPPAKPDPAAPVESSAAEVAEEPKPPEELSEAEKIEYLRGVVALQQTQLRQAQAAISSLQARLTAEAAQRESAQSLEVLRAWIAARAAAGWSLDAEVGWVRDRPLAAR